MKFKVIMLPLLFLSGCSIFAPYYDESTEDTQAAAAIERPDISSIYMVEAYEIAATRTVNKMLDDTAEYYEKKPAPKLYIKKIVKDSPNLPDGLYSAQRSMKQIIEGAGAYIVVNKLEEADYILSSNVSEADAGEQPAILFKMMIEQKDGQQLKAWTVTIKQMTEDKSWW